MDKIPIVLIGGGGHATSLLEIIEGDTHLRLEGFIDLSEKVGTSLHGYNYIGDDTCINDLIDKKYRFHIALGQIKTANVRKEYYDLLVSKRALFYTLIANTAYLSSNSTIGEGSAILHQVFINNNAHIGNNTIINTKALIEHDAVIGNHCHVSTAVVVNGNCIIGNEVFIGSNSVLVQGINIVDRVVVAAGSVVTKSLEKPGLYAGNPCKFIKYYA